jgi:hypothetical protein
VIADEVGGEEIVVFFQRGTVSALDRSTIAESSDVGATGVFVSELKGRCLRFDPVRDGFRDRETETTWNLLGHATSGELKGSCLPRTSICSGY